MKCPARIARANASALREFAPRCRIEEQNQKNSLLSSMAGEVCKKVNSFAQVQRYGESVENTEHGKGG
jgi:hypothetical protein